MKQFVGRWLRNNVGVYRKLLQTLDGLAVIEHSLKNLDAGLNDIKSLLALPDKTLHFTPKVSNRGFTITGPTKDKSIIGSIEAHGGEYEPHVCNIVSRFVDADKVALDIGANIGVLTVLMASRAKKVHAFEATQMAGAYLKRNVKDNNLNNVFVYENAVSNVSGQTLTFHFNKEFLGGAFSSNVSDKFAEQNSQTVMTISIDDWVKNNAIDRIDFIKLDIEGSELLALEGASQTIKKFQPVMIVECNANTLVRFQKKTAGDLLTMLQGFFPHIYVVSDDPKFGLVPIQKTEELEDILRYGRGVEDLLTTFSPPTDFAFTKANDFITNLKWCNSEREILIDPAFKILVREPQMHTKMQAGSTIQVGIHLQNLSNRPWKVSRQQTINISYHWYDKSGDLLLRDGLRTGLPKEIKGGSGVDVDMKIEAPTQPGEYILALTMVQEGLMWLEDLYPEGVFRSEVQVVIPS